jgi:hypothetical protein
VSNLDRLNELRRTAKALGLTGYGRMKTIDLAAAVEAEQAKRDVNATPERREDIIVELARIGAVLYPQGTKEHAAYREALTKALADPNAFSFLGDVPVAHAPVEPRADCADPECAAAAVPDTEIDLADAIDADDRDAIHAIGAGTPDVVVTGAKYETDPNATRYEDVERWTDDRLYSKEEELARRLTRRTLLGGDRKLTENRLSRIRKVIESRGL